MRTQSLSPELRERYERDGYIVLPAVFDAEEIAAMSAEADRLAELAVRSSIVLGERNPRLDVQRRDGRLILRKIQPVADLSETLARFASDPRLLDPMRAILGCEPLLMEEKLNYKQQIPDESTLEAGTEGERFLPHTDWAYFANDGYPPETLSSALSIDASTPDNGPIRVLPGSHVRDYPQREGYPPVLADGAVDEAELIDVLAPAGSVMIFHSKLVHSSSENTSVAPRRILIFSHYPATHPAEPDQRNRLLRERGRDHERRYREALAAGAREPGYSVTIRRG